MPKLSKDDSAIAVTSRDYKDNKYDMLDGCASSTPVLRRTHSASDSRRTHLEADSKLSFKQDSGFAEISSYTYNDSQHIKADRDVVCDSLRQDSQFQSPCDEHQQRLKTMGFYYEKLEKWSPLQKRIGRRMGEEFVDAISELHVLQIPPLSTILNLLDDEDLPRLVLLY